MKNQRLLASIVLAGMLVTINGCASTVQSTGADLSANSAAAATEVSSEAAAEEPTAAAQMTEKEASEKGGDNDTITVTAVSTVQETPDIAKISFGVTTRADTAAAAQKRNTGDVDKVIDKLKALGVDEKSIQTSGYSMYPDYDYNNNNAIIGYNVETSLTISDQKISDVGSIITECVNAGINNINDIEYTCSTYDEKYLTALQQAVAAADTKAAALAEACHRQLGLVTSMTEGYQDTSARYKNANTSLDAAAAEESAFNVQPGQMEINAQVTVTYQLD